MRHTLASFKDTFNSTSVLNITTTNSDYLKWLNEALQRLLAPGMWVGTTGKYQVCASKGTVTWARQWETIEALDFCNSPMAIRNKWYEFLEAGPGLTHTTGPTPMAAIDRGSGFVMFEDLAVPSIIRLYPQFGVDDHKIVNIRGLDLNGNVVLTNTGNTVGEDIELASPFVDSVTIWGAQTFHEVIKAKTKGFVRAFAYDATLPPPPAIPGPLDTPLTALAVWEPGETLPDYRRSWIPAIETMKSGCQGCSSTDFTDCGTDVTLTVIAKHKFITIENDLDFLPIGNAPALKLAMRAVMLEERGDSAGARVAMHGTYDPIKMRFIDGAIPLLEEELESHQGDGTVITLRKNPDRLGGSAVATFI